MKYFVKNKNILSFTPIWNNRIIFDIGHKGGI